MNYYLDIQHACEDTLPVSDDTLKQWVNLTLTPYRPTAELTLRVVNKEEIQQLNHLYRKKNKTTNVLSFPASYPKEIALDYPFLGDVVICPAVLEEESVDLHKPLTSHWAHIVIHGVLHLLGYDHIKDEEAVVMQAIETKLLAALQIEDPYQTQSNDDKG